MASHSTVLSFLGFLILIVCSETIPSSRILGGTDATSGKYPWVASLRIDGSHVCSGSIINSRYIITAAHCVSGVNSSQITARIGSINQFAGGKIVQIETIVVHPLFGNFLHDIALLKVNQTLIFDEKINSILLANEDDIIEDSAPVLVTGWGLTQHGSSSYKLQHISMFALNSEECERQAGYGYKSVLCLGHSQNQGICEGDSGAGVVSSIKLVGVASFSFGSCGTIYPDISSKISHYRSWINSVIS